MEDRTTELTATADRTPEQIERDMARTRESITEKVAALETQVLGTVQTAADVLTGTVDNVKSLLESAPETVQHAAEAVTESVREALDVTGCIRRNPWAAVGTSAGCGLVAGLLMFRRESPSLRQQQQSPQTAPGTGAIFHPAAVADSTARSSPDRGIFDGLVEMLGRKLREIVETTIDSATAAVNRKLQESAPKLVDAAGEILTPAHRNGFVGACETK